MSQVAKAQAAEETFTYQAGGSQVTLVRDTEHIVVRYVRDATKPRVARQLPPGYKRLKGYEVANSDIEVLESPEPKKSGKLTPERAKAIAEELSQSGAVQYIEHPYFRQGSREVLTPTRQLLIRLGKGVTLGQVLPIEVVKGSEMLKGTIDTFIVNLSDTSTEDMLRQLKAITETPGVLWAEPNFQMTLKTSQLAPPVNDPHYPDQWHLNNTGQSLGTAGADVGAAEAWGLLGSGGTPDVKIAIIDHGVQLDHPDIVIATNLEEVNGQDGVDDDLNGYPDDKKGIRVRDPDLQGSPIVVTDGSPDDVLANHGTAVAGTAAATGNNGIGVAGLAHGASLLPIGLG